MKQMKRTLSLVLALVMLLSLGTTAFAGEVEEPVQAVEEVAQPVQPVEEAPVEEAPAAEAPVEEAPVAETPVEEVPAAETPVEDAPVAEVPVEEAPAAEAPVEEAPAEEAPAEEAAAEEAAEEEETPIVGNPAYCSYPQNVNIEDPNTGLKVRVEIPAYALPEGAGLRARYVNAADYAYGAALVGENAEVKLALDISFLDFSNGRPEVIEPAEGTQIAVYVTAPELAGLTDAKVVHFSETKRGPELVDLLDVPTAENEIAFKSGEFSVYAVVGNGNNGDNARVEVNFFNGENKIATMYVKNSDTAEELEKIVYDPGAGTLQTGEQFLGWTTVKNYDAESEHKTIDMIRSDLEALNITEGMEPVNYYAVIFKTVTLTYLDGDGIAVQADSERLIGSTESIEMTVNANPPAVDSEHHFEGWNVAEGSAANIISAKDADGNDVEAPYPNGTVLTLSGSVTLSMYAPEGHWLVFNENGKGATYNAPRFLETDEVTERPRPDSEMVRFGYTFGGWYADEACTEEFQFNSTISKLTNVYAKWIAVDKANYTVIVWKQNVDGVNYDFVSPSYTFEGTVGNKVQEENTVVRQNDTTVRVNGQNISFTGFHVDADKCNTAVEIKPEGNAVVNVYFDRNEYTLTFRDYNYTQNNNGSYGLVNGIYVPLSTSGGNRYYLQYSDGTPVPPGATVYYRSFMSWNSTSSPSYNTTYYAQQDYNTELTWVRYSGNRYNRSSSVQTIKTITKLYEQSLTEDFPIVGSNGATYPTGTRWMPANGMTVDGTVYFSADTVVSYIDKMPPGNMTFTRNDPGARSNKTMVYWLETINNQPSSSSANTKTYRGVLYEEYKTVVAAYTGITQEDYIELEGFKHFEADKQTSGNSDPSKNFYMDGNSYASEVNFYYTRLKYSILYMDGKYVDGNGNNINENNQGKLNEIEHVTYGVDLSSYNKDGDNYYIPTSSGYVFEGWFLDDACTHPYTFSTMPASSITVYAKWRQIQYRVFLHPNAGTDSTLSWGDEEKPEDQKQAMNFRISLGGKVSTPDGTRTGYKFLGWYLDDGVWNQNFNQDAFVLNESTVTTPYDKSVDMTDPMDKYGNIGANPYNSDAERDWITKKLDIYARWSAILTGANGINVQYVAGEGSNPPTDSTLYIDTAKAVAQAASTAPEGKRFSHWVLQTWNGSASAFEDTSTTVVPGAEFSVLKANARITEKVDSGDGAVVDPADVVEGNSYVYTVQLRAEYVDAEKPTPTHITWYSNLKDVYGATMELDKFTTEVTENDPAKGWYVTDKSDGSLMINEAIDIRPATTYSYAGFNFLGWAKDAAATASDLFLKFVDGKFYAKDEQGNFTVEVTQVAADEKKPIDDLYAVWEADYFYVYHSATGKLEAVDMGQLQNGAFNLVSDTAPDSLYGGYFSASGAATAENVEAAKEAAKTASDKMAAVTGAAVYDGKSLKNGTVRFWEKTNAAGVLRDGAKVSAGSGNAVTPQSGDVFYLKEVPNCYLCNSGRWVYDTVNNNEIKKLYMLTGIDDTLYNEVGYVIVDKGNEVARIVSSFSFQQRYSSTITKVKAADVIHQRGYLGVVDATNYIDTIVSSATVFNPYWKTLDGVEIEVDGCVISCTGGDKLTHDNISIG